LLLRLRSPAGAPNHVGGTDGGLAGFADVDDDETAVGLGQMPTARPIAFTDRAETRPVPAT
jgi:hypothetical protein